MAYVYKPNSVIPLFGGTAIIYLATALLL